MQHVCRFANTEAGTSIVARKIAFNPNMILSPGTQVVTRVEVTATGGQVQHPQGAVGEILRSPVDHTHSYRIRFPDGSEAALRRTEFAVLKQVQRDQIWSAGNVLDEFDLFDCVIYRCVVGSQAYGLADAGSDVDRRGIYVPPAEMQWSLFGVPEQLENPETEECYWELQKFLTLALKANPNVLECLYTPVVEYATPLARELLDMREAFLSKLVYQTYNGYVLSQFKKLEAHLKNHGEIKWKHAMHLIRLLLSGIVALRDGHVPLDVEPHREQLLAIRHGELPWDEINRWRLSLHREFDQAFEHTKLPDRPDFEKANALLIRARRAQVGERTTVRATPVVGAAPADVPDPVADASLLRSIIVEQPYPLIFVTISGAHLYGFPSPDSDYDLRGTHVLPLNEVVGLATRRETIEASTIRDGLEIDLVTHDVKKFFGLLLKRNGYVLEQLLSPLVLYTTPEHEELKALAQGCITRHHAHHYLGFVKTQWKLFDKDRRVKPLLYVYRVLLTGIYLMRTGQVEANVVRLNEEFGLQHLDDLIAQKTGGTEKGVLECADVEFHQREYERLTVELERARDASQLPEAPTTRSAINDLLVRVRTGQGNVHTQRG